MITDTEKARLFRLFLPKGTSISTRGSTLFGASVHPLHLMITESPCRIRAAPRWSSDNNQAGCSHHLIPLWNRFTAYSSLQRFIMDIIASRNALSSLKNKLLFIMIYSRYKRYN